MVCKHINYCDKHKNYKTHFCIYHEDMENCSLARNFYNKYGNWTNHLFIGSNTEPLKNNLENELKNL